jgi:hypothetical protein
VKEKNRFPFCPEMGLRSYPFTDAKRQFLFCPEMGLQSYPFTYAKRRLPFNAFAGCKGCYQPDLPLYRQMMGSFSQVVAAVVVVGTSRRDVRKAVTANEHE